jgi:hypothetical protein
MTSPTGVLTTMLFPSATDELSPTSTLLALSRHLDCKRDGFEVKPETVARIIRARREASNFIWLVM